MLSTGSAAQGSDFGATNPVVEQPGQMPRASSASELFVHKDRRPRKERSGRIESGEADFRLGKSSSSGHKVDAGEDRITGMVSRSPAVRWHRILGLVAVAVICTGIFLYAEEFVAPDIFLLSPEQGAQWIRRPRPFSLGGWGGTKERTFFRGRVKIPARATGVPPVVTVRALWSFAVLWDGKQIFTSDLHQSWKESHDIPLPASAPGTHSLEILVENIFGPAAVLAYCESLGVFTGPDWQDWDGEHWEPVATVDQIELPKFSHQFPSPARALRSSLWWLAPLFLLAWGVLGWQSRQSPTPGTPTWLTASRCRWVVLAAWFALAVNNFSSLPANLGYDLSGHVDYIRFVAERGRLPLASDGYQMFQAPLYYMISAALDRLLSLVVPGDRALIWLRWVPLLCGMAQVEICFSAGRCVFPGREDLQTLAVVIGGLLPMNLYMSQVLSNEPLYGVLSAVVFLLCWQCLKNPEFAQQSGWQWGLGAILGLAMLTKVSAALLWPLVAVVLALANWPRGWKPTLTAGLRCFGIAAVLCGWFYVRNWLHFGQAFIGGWSPVTGIRWWQDPGYRTPLQMASFGQSLLRPIHSAFYSIWDGFYSTLWLDGNLSSMDSWESRPPWNETLMLAAPWPALLLTLALGAGMLSALRCRDVVRRKSLRLAGGMLLVLLAAFAVLCLKVPAYSQAKASYTLGLTPAYAILCAAGLDLLPKKTWVRSAVLAGVICWGVLAYGAYFVV
jgi:hypothetical protein